MVQRARRWGAWKPRVVLLDGAAAATGGQLPRSGSPSGFDLFEGSRGRRAWETSRGRSRRETSGGCSRCPLRPPSSTGRRRRRAGNSPEVAPPRGSICSKGPGATEQGRPPEAAPAEKPLVGFRANSGRSSPESSSSSSLSSSSSAVVGARGPRPRSSAAPGATSPPAPGTTRASWGAAAAARPFPSGSRRLLVLSASPSRPRSPPFFPLSPSPSFASILCLAFASSLSSFASSSFPEPWTCARCVLGLRRARGLRWPSVGSDQQDGRGSGF